MPNDSGYKQKRLAQIQLRQQAVGATNVVLSKIAGYDLKKNLVGDLYEGEAENRDFDAIWALHPFRMIYQITVGEHGRHGDNKPDRAAASFIQQSKDREILYLLYHLLLPGSAQKQADFFCRSVDAVGGPGNGMPVVDIEVTWAQGTAWADTAEQWCDIVETRYGEAPMIYSSKYYLSFLNYRQYVPGEKKPQILPPPWLKKHWGWFAGYLLIPFMDNYMAAIPPGYEAAGFDGAWGGWQYYDKAGSNPPRGYTKFPLNDISMMSDAWVAYMNSKYSQVKT